MAVDPPPELVDALQRMERPELPGVRWSDEAQWHVTLKYFAAVDPDRLVEALGGLRYTAPVVARAGPRPGVLGGRVWVLPVAGLDALAEAVTAATADLDGSGERRPFRGHLTLARARRGGGMRGVGAPDLSMEWLVREVVAVRSELRTGGAVHTRLAAWPVGPR